MNARELITALKTCDPEAPVVIRTEDTPWAEVHAIEQMIGGNGRSVHLKVRP